MTLPTVTYLSMDSLQEGVGASQVLPYVRELARRGVTVSLHTFEKRPPPSDLKVALRQDGVRWQAHGFGPLGSAGGAARVLRGAAVVHAAELLHARSDLAAASALLARAGRWIWDMRSFWADQRIDLGMLHAGSSQERVLRFVERQAARRCSAIIALTPAAFPVLAERHGAHVVEKGFVVRTCADLDRFALSPLPPIGMVRFLLAGTLNRYYDVESMLRLVAGFRRRRAATLQVLSAGETPWEHSFRDVGAERGAAAPGEMPGHVAASHVGLSVCRNDVGVSLKAAMPTKVAEFLASGRPVVVNSGLGDLSALLDEYRCGVSLNTTDAPALEDAMDELEALLADPDTPQRCRALAERHFNLDRAVDALIDVYERVTGEHRGQFSRSS